MITSLLIILFCFNGLQNPKNENNTNNSYFLDSSKINLNNNNYIELNKSESDKNAKCTYEIILEYFKVAVYPLLIISFIIYFRKEISKMLLGLRKINIPGGISFEAFEKKLEEADKISEDVKKDVEERNKKIKTKSKLSINKDNTEINSRLIELGLKPSLSGLQISFFKDIANSDPVLAMAALRIDLETMLKNIAKSYKINIYEKSSFRNILNNLLDKGKITYDQYKLIRIIYDLCSAAIHGYQITNKEVDEILDKASVLIDDFLSWLSWGFTINKENKSKNEGFDHDVF